MSFINPKQKEVTFKIVYAGAPFSGKSSSLRYLYERLGGNGKKNPLTLSDSTLFFDFIPLSLGKIDNINVHVHVYTLPSQKAYDTTCKMILKGVDGVIFVVDSQIDKIQESYEHFETIQKQVEPENSWSSLPVAFQYNKRDLKQSLAAEELDGLFNKTQAPSFETVATRGENVMDAFQSVAKQILLDLKK